jgi:hypothetical protein
VSFLTPVVEENALDELMYLWPYQLLRYVTQFKLIIDLLSSVPMIIGVVAYWSANHNVLYVEIARVLQLLKLVELTRSPRTFTIIKYTVVNSYKTFLVMFW